MKLIVTIFLLVLSCNVFAEKPLLRLFYSPNERAKIDSERRAPVKKENGNVSTKPKTEIITVKGYLKRKGKSDVVWLNDKNTLKSNKLLPDVRVVSVGSKGKINLQIKNSGRVKVKPGKVLSIDPKIVIEAYEIKNK